MSVSIQWFLAMGFSLLMLASDAAALGQEVTRADLARVRYELSKVEDKLNAAGGKPMELSSKDREAFTMVKEFAERDGNNPDVKALVDEAKRMYNEAKGVRLEITADMLAYRTRQKDLVKQLGQLADQQWQSLQKASDLMEKPFPVALPPDVDPDSILGQTIILEDIPYESSLFVQMGRNWVPVGDVERGFYFVDASSPEFTSLFIALQRYRDQVQNQLPEKWVIAGQIDTPAMLAPDGTDQRAGTPRVGWVLRPTAIYVPGMTLVTLDKESELGAQFAGESESKSWRKYSITEVPDDVDPMELVRIYITAIKEKNWDLHLQCLDPSLRDYPTQLHGLRYNWEIQQKGLENFHAHAEVVEMTEVEVTRGAVDNDLEDFFGDGEVRKPALKRQEKTRVMVRLFDDQGIQTVRPRYVSLVRNEGGRWYIWLGGTLLF